MEDRFQKTKNLRRAGVTANTVLGGTMGGLLGAGITRPGDHDVDPHIVSGMAALNAATFGVGTHLAHKAMWKKARENAKTA